MPRKRPTNFGPGLALGWADQFLTEIKKDHLPKSQSRPITQNGLFLVTFGSKNAQTGRSLPFLKIVQFSKNAPILAAFWPLIPFTAHILAYF